jgi:hypothetical protein
VIGQTIVTNGLLYASSGPFAFPLEGRSRKAFDQGGQD